MLRRILSVGVMCGLLAVAGHAGLARAEVKQVPTVRVHSEVRIDAGAAPIWRYVTTGTHFPAWMPEWNQPRNTRLNLVKVGNWMDSVDEWNNKGRAVVTYIARNKELRFANEPINGSFMCQTKLVLLPDGTGTLVHLTHQYTDESEPTALSATAAKVQVSLDRSLAAVKAAVERRVR